MRPAREKVLFSIVTVVYNGENAIEKTINSVAMQDFDGYEYIVLDGGSKDRTTDIIRNNEEKISLWQSGKDNGVYDAMNKAAALATGEWILFLNTGDLFAAPDILSRTAIELVAHPGINLAYGDVLLNDATHTRIASKTFGSVRFGMPFCHQSVFVKTELLKRHPFKLQYRITADYAFFLDLFRDEQVRYRQMPFAVAVFDMEGLSYNHNVFVEYYKVVRDYYGNAPLTWYHFIRSRYKLLRTGTKKIIKKILPV